MSAPDFWPDAKPPKGFFDLFREGQYPTLYPEHKTPVTSDVLEAGFIYAAVILAFSLLLILPGIRSGDRFSTFIRIIVFVFVLASIMLSNFGQEWEVAHIYTKTPYRAGLRKEIKATIGVKIGLRSVNITLKGDPVIQVFNEGRVNETVNYNERLSWDNRGWLLGRLGFGPFAGKFNQEFREHQRRGSPYPILWVAEYFTVDGEGLRWGRYYLQAGYYAHIMVWTALPLWLLSVILYKMIIRYGAYFSILTGFSLLAANIIYATVRNPLNLRIPFENDTLTFSWGWSFKLCAFTGVLCCIIGIVVLILDQFASEKLSDFFGVDITQELEEFYVDPNQVEEDIDTSGGHWARRKRTRRPTMILKTSAGGLQDEGADMGRPASPRAVQIHDPSEDIEMQAATGSPGTAGYQRNDSQQQEIQRGYRRRTGFPMSKSQKKQPRPLPPRRDPPKPPSDA